MTGKPHGTPRDRPPQRGTVDTYALAHVCGFAWALNWMEGPESAYARHAPGYN